MCKSKDGALVIWALIDHIHVLERSLGRYRVITGDIGAVAVRSSKRISRKYGMKTMISNSQHLGYSNAVSHHHVSRST